MSASPVSGADSLPALPADASAPPPPPRPGRRRAGLVAALLAAVLGGASLFVSGYSLGRLQSATPGTPAEEQALFQPFWDAYNAIVNEYVGPVDRKKLVEGAIGGMFGALGDPFSQYLSSEQFKSSLSGISGQFEGIGAYMTTKDATGAQGCSPIGPTCRLTVVSTIRGSPALTAGLLANDVVSEVNGTNLDGKSVDDAVNLIRGPRGTVVRLTIIRDDRGPFVLPITRDVVQQEAVQSSVIANGQVGYLKLDGFNSSAAPDFKAQLKALVDQGLTRIVFDLRGDPGGFVDAARDIASQFIGSGPVFYQEYADGRRVAQEAAPGGVATDPRIKVIVLIDKGSASASEIVAGALQATGRATLVGQTSYGKGTIQQFQALPNDSGGFRLSVAKWLTPRGIWINGKGLTPDVPVTVPPNTPAGQDPVLQKAIDLLVGSHA